VRTPSFVRCVAAYLGSVLLALWGWATVAAYWPAFEKLRFDEDYSGIREAAEGASFPENITHQSEIKSTDRELNVHR
jgi:hypothetical protein